MTVADLIYSGFRIAGILREAGRAQSASATTDGLAVLNAMLNSWKAERLMVYAILRSTFNTTANVGLYTIGASTPDWALERPEQLHQVGRVYTTVSPEMEVPLDPLTQQEWALIAQKGLTASTPSKYYYEPAVPNGKLNLWPIATGVVKIALYTWQTVNQFAATSDAVLLAPAYQEAIEYNLAIRLAARFPERQSLSPMSVELARNAIARVKTINQPELIMQTEAAMQGRIAGGGSFNILTNRYN